MLTLTSVEAQNRFGELLDKAQREPVTITRRGRPVAVVLSPQDAADLLAERQRRADAVATFDAYFAEADAHLTDAARDLTDEDIVRLVHELR
jgi:prevent-host-death family protein